LDTILHQWSWRRFERMFQLHLLRKARDELREMRDLRLAALDANMNFDSKDGIPHKQQRTEALHDAFREAIYRLYSPVASEPQESQEEDPLFAPLRRKADSSRDQALAPLAPQAGMGRALLHE
jgi:hypothetical protein